MILNEIALTKYMPFSVHGRIGTPQGIKAVTKAVDSEIGEIKWAFSLSAAQMAKLPTPTVGIQILAHDHIKVLTRSLTFSSSSVGMTHTNQDTNVSIPVFSTLIKFLTWFIEQEHLKVPFENRTGMIEFSAASGDSRAHAAARSATHSPPTENNARDRIYALLVKQLEHQGVCTLISHKNNHFYIMLKDFVDVAVRANIIRRV